LAVTDLPPRPKGRGFPIGELPTPLPCGSFTGSVGIIRLGQSDPLKDREKRE